MAELFVMCPECGLNAKLAPGEPKIKDHQGLCKHRRSPMACPILGPILEQCAEQQPARLRPTRPATIFR
jgi:hypothetical protein